MEFYNYTIVIVWFLFCALAGSVICFLSLVKHSVIATDIFPVKVMVVVALFQYFLFIYLFLSFCWELGILVTSEDMVYAVIRNFEPVLFCQIT